MTSLAPILPGEEDDAACDRCGKADALDIAWSHVWQQYLCLVCRALAVDAEHRMTLAQRRALDARAAEAS